MSWRFADFTKGVSFWLRDGEINFVEHATVELATDNDAFENAEP
jgi:hypothetical protein